MQLQSKWYDMKMCGANSSIKCAYRHPGTIWFIHCFNMKMNWIDDYYKYSLRICRLAFSFNADKNLVLIRLIYQYFSQNRIESNLMNANPISKQNCILEYLYYINIKYHHVYDIIMLQKRFRDSCMRYEKDQLRLW